MPLATGLARIYLVRMPNVQPETIANGDSGSVATGSAVLPGVAHDFHAWLEQRRNEFETALSAHLDEIESGLGTHSRMGNAVVYSVRAGGKRVRPILVLESCGVCGVNPGAAMPAAIAMELIHTFSLIHDDLPAMDDDELRRGKPSNHKVYGEALAVLSGDWLMAHALSLVADERLKPSISTKLVATLLEGTKAMIAGQAADVDNEQRAADRELVRYIHQHKTAALIEACCRLGTQAADAPADVVVALGRYGRHLGLAFQITDDLLDQQGNEEQLGKHVGKDAAASKQTYPAAFGIEESRAQAAREVDAALAALESFGGRADRLRDLARYVICRDH
jgi:geranylgeranyl diphosphate synthase type II